MDIFIQLVINGLLLGGAYTIISLGLTLIFGVVRVVNFAHGEFLMIGMYLVYLIAAQFGVHPYVGLVPVAVILFALGALCLLYTSPSPRDQRGSRMPSSA